MMRRGAGRTASVPGADSLLAGVRRERARVIAVIGASASYAALFTILLVQALAGESIAAPSPGTVSALGAWAALSIGVAIATWRIASASTVVGPRTAMEVA